MKVHYAQVSVDKKNEDVALATAEEEEAKKRKKKKKEESSGTSAVAEFFADLFTGVNSQEGVLVLFAVVGVVITVVWIASVPYTAYKAITGKEQFDNIHLAILGYARIISKSPEKYFDRTGEISSLKYNLYFKPKEESETDNFHIGMAAELGHYQLRDIDEFKNITNHVAGNYWLLGPAVMIGFEPDFMSPIYFKFDLQGGSSFRSDIDLIAKADFGVYLEIFRNVLLGANISANYIDIKDNKGIISGSHPDYLLGLNLGYKF